MEGWVHVNSMNRFIFATVVFCSSVFAENEPNLFRNELGLNLGPGNPCGYLCLEYSRLLEGHHALSLGGGASFAGANLSLGYKYLFKPSTRFNPFLGLSGFYASGLPFVVVQHPWDHDFATYETLPGFAIAPRAGIRYQTGWLVNLYVNVGYAVVVQGGGARFLKGREPDSVYHASAEKYALGGPELSMSIMFRFGQSSP